MNRILLLALTLLFINCSTVQATTPTLAGPSGLVLTRTAEILDKGEHSATVFGVMDTYDIDVDGAEKVTDTEYIGAFHFLMFENLELGVVGSMLQPDTKNLSRSETNYLNGVGKVRLAGGRDQGFGIAASGYASLNRYKADPLVSSGEDIYGGEFNVSFFGEGASLHLAAGAKQDDVRKFTNVSSTFVYAKQKYITVAIEMTPTPNLSYSLEWMRSTINEKDNVTHVSEIYQMAMLSLKYSVNKFTFSAGAGMEIPDSDADPEYDHFKYLLGLTYGYDKPKDAPKPADMPAAMPANSPMTAPFNSISQELDELRGEIEDIKNNKSKLSEEEAIAQPMLEPVDPVETEAGASVEAVAVGAGAVAAATTTKGSNPYEYLRVEVINVSGLAGLGEDVADILEKAGFNIVKIESLEVSNKQKSFILHKKAFINEGVMVAREIPRDQDVLISKRLSSKVDVRVVVGKDLKFIMNK